MSNPRNATTAKSGSRFYSWTNAEGQVETFPSVTTILKDGIPKPALVAWGPKMAAEFVADNLTLLNEMAKDKNAREMIVQVVKGSPYRERDAAAGIGTLIHDVAEAMVLGLPLPAYEDKHAGFVRSLRMFIDDWKPSFEASEASVYNRAAGYAGTLDFIATFPGLPGRFVCDWKTTKPGRQGHGIYPEAMLQLAAYAKAEFIGLPNGTEEPMPEIHDVMGINIRPNGYTVVPRDPETSIDSLYRTFRYVQQVAQFQNNGFGAVGKPLAPPTTEVA